MSCSHWRDTVKILLDCLQNASFHDDIPIAPKHKPAGKTCIKRKGHHLHKNNQLHSIIFVFHAFKSTHVSSNEMQKGVSVNTEALITHVSLINHQTLEAAGTCPRKRKKKELKYQNTNQNWRLGRLWRMSGTEKCLSWKMRRLNSSLVSQWEDEEVFEEAICVKINQKPPRMTPRGNGFRIRHVLR